MKAIIIGATSGIGRELAIQMSNNGYVVGITGRRSNLLDSLEKELSGKCYKLEMNLLNVTDSINGFKQLLKDMDGVDIVVVSSGIGSFDLEFPISDELETIAVNVTGFTAIANTAYHYFLTRGKGHIVGISSIAAIRGGPIAAYNASKAYISSYLEGLACRLHSQNKNIFVTDIRPGFVDTAMAQGERLFWVAPVDKAVIQIIKVIRKKRNIAYVTKRWRIVALILSLLPSSLYRKIGG